jgi:carbon catabolite-derepressing protein kinase
MTQLLELKWRTPGVYKEQLRHRDGSLFPVFLEITPFEDDTRMFSGRIRRVVPPSSSVSTSPRQRIIGDYQIIRTIGQGTFGKVKLACHKITRQTVAVKILVKGRMTQEELQRALREIDILKKLHHPNIAALYDVIEDDSAINIVMEYCSQTLFDYIKQNRCLTEEKSREMFKEILSAIQYCHSHNIIHRDIKHDNILLDDKGNCKIIDFGLSNFVEEGKSRATFCGSPAYCSPEMVSNKSTKSD